MSISDSTLANAEAAFTTIISLSDLPTDSDFLFRIISEIKMGWEIWITEPATPGVPEAKKLYIFRENERSKAKAVKTKPEEKEYPFLFFCAYIPSKKILQFVKIKSKNVFNDITSTYRRYLPEQIFDEATCIIHKGTMQGKPSYTFSLATFLDKSGVPAVAKTALPQECLDLMSTLKFDMDKIYENQDPFTA